MKKSLVSQYLLLFGLSIIIRLLFLVVEFLIFNNSADAFLSRSDAGSYLAVSKGIYLGPENATMSNYDKRVFLGWPLIFGWGNWLGIGLEVMSLMTLLLSALVPCLFFRLSQNFAASLLLCFFTPAWILQTINPMGEASYLFFGLLAVLFFKKEQLFASGLAVGLMFAIRPYAIVVIGGIGLALAWMLFYSRGRERLLLKVGMFVLGCALFPGICGLLNIHMYGNLFHQLHAYSGSLDDMNIATDAARALGNPKGHWGLPFWNIVSFPWKVPTPLWKTDYVYVHLIILVFVMIYGVRKIKPIFAQDGDSIDQIMLCWFLGNSLLIICSGPYWGFHSFDRYFLWGWPPMLWLLKEHIRFRWVTFLPLIVLSMGLVAFSLLRHFVK